MNAVAAFYNNPYSHLAASRVQLLTQVLSTVINGEQSILLPILKALVILFIARQFFLVMFGHMTMHRLWSSAVRALVIVFLVHGVTNFNSYVVQKVFTNLPQAMTNLGVGSYAPTATGANSAEQFDQVSAAGSAIRSQVVGKVTLDPRTWINAFGITIADGGFQIIMALIFGIWFLGLNLLAIALCLGPPLLCFEFFDRTRGFVDQWIGKIVGIAAHGLAASVILGMELQSLQDLMKAANGLADSNVATAVTAYWSALGNAVLDLLLIAACPLAFAFGSGAVAALALPSALAAGRTLMGAAAVTRVGGRVAATVATGAAKAASADRIARGYTT